MVLYFISAQSQSKHICCVPLNHKTEYVHDLPQPQTYSVLSCSIWITECCLSCCVYLLCNHCPFTSVLAGKNAANISVVYQAELMQQISFAAPSCLLMKTSQYHFLSWHSRQTSVVVGSLCFPVVFKRHQPAILYPKCVAQDSLSKRENQQ